MKKFWVGVVAFCVVGFVSVGGWILYQEVNLRNLQAQVEEYERISDKMHQDLEEAGNQTKVFTAILWLTMID